MTRFRLMLAAGALSLAAAAASAQPGPADQPAPNPSPAMGAPAQNQPDAGGQDMNAPAQNHNAPAQNQDAAPSATGAGANTSAQVVAPSDAPPAQTQALAGGGNTLVTNGPVPDTPANRAKYGGPMSLTGKHTKPAGN
jgi:hypothetical protein